MYKCTINRFIPNLDSVKFKTLKLLNSMLLSKNVVKILADVDSLNTVVLKLAICLFKKKKKVFLLPFCYTYKY